MNRKYIKKAVYRLIALFHKLGFYAAVQGALFRFKVIDWKATPLALKGPVSWNESVDEMSPTFQEVSELTPFKDRHLSPPSVVLSDLLEPEKRQVVEQKFRSYESVQDHAIKVVTGSSIRLASDANNVLLISANGHPIKGLSVAMNGINFVQEHLIWPRVTQLLGHTLMGSAAMAEANYYHWTLEVLPRLGAVLNSGFRWHDFDQFLIRNKGLPFQIESLQALGCPLSRVVQEVGRACFDCERLTTVTHPANYIPSEFAVNYLAGPFAEAVKAQKGAEKKASYPEKIYLSRLGTRRQLANEAALTEALREKGFTTVDLGTCSLDEQIYLFEHARVIVGPHGAGFANLVYCKAGTRVVEVFHPNHVETMYWGIATHKQLEYSPYCLASHEEEVSIQVLLKLLA